VVPGIALFAYLTYAQQRVNLRRAQEKWLAHMAGPMGTTTPNEATAISPYDWRAAALPLRSCLSRVTNNKGFTVVSVVSRQV